MKGFAKEKLYKFRNEFPELTDAQYETAMLLSIGINKKDIAVFRNVSYVVVRDTLQEIKNRMDFYSVNHIQSVFQCRLVTFGLTQCVLNEINRHNTNS
ncbi:transcriptional regulator (plasmid) [Arsenophonus sp. aPb]|uniref:transcriptional regulator n=1 Tax=Arsenophonus sp. aPb TaxID=3041619 RepID=UPI0024687EFE|nr:transcriptional regulator [Arsenophonus sp. aPb]WGL99826.1 transcriptional regulator [Arsenophonus sp. aPb]